MPGLIQRDNHAHIYRQLQLISNHQLTSHECLWAVGGNWNISVEVLVLRAEVEILNPAVLLKRLLYICIDFIYSDKFGKRLDSGTDLVISAVYLSIFKLQLYNTCFDLSSVPQLASDVLFVFVDHERWKEDGL